MCSFSRSHAVCLVHFMWGGSTHWGRDREDWCTCGQRGRVGLCHITWDDSWRVQPSWKTKKTYGIGAFFWIGEDFKNWNSWNWSWQHSWAWYSINYFMRTKWYYISLLYQGVFLGVKIQTRHQMLVWSPGVLLCFLIFSHKMTSKHFRSRGFVPPKNLSKSYSPNKLPEFSETYEPYWTTGDVLADLQAYSSEIGD